MNINFRTCLIMALLLVVALNACGPAGQDSGQQAEARPAQPVFSGAWIRALPPGMKMTAGFGTLQNETAGDITLVGFSSPAFGDVSLHRTERVDGVSRMREVKHLSLAAGESVELAPGGYHLMLMMPAGPIEPGQSVAIRMHAEDGRSFHFEIPVERR